MPSSAALVNRLRNSSVSVMSSGVEPSANLLRYMDFASVERHEDRTAHGTSDEFGDMAFPRRILHQHDFTWADEPCLTVTGGDVHGTVQIDDVLAARSRMPIDRLILCGFTKND